MNRVLIANRGEIACRIIRSCQALGLETVAVYSEADAHALHVELADGAAPIGPAPARQSYLDMDAVIAAARAAGNMPSNGREPNEAAVASAVRRWMGTAMPSDAGDWGSSRDSVGIPITKEAS